MSDPENIKRYPNKETRQKVCGSLKAKHEKKDHSSPHKIVAKINDLRSKHSNLSLRELLSKAFTKDITEDAKAKTPTNPLGAGRNLLRGVKTGSAGAIYGGQKRTKQMQSAMKKGVATTVSSEQFAKIVGSDKFAVPFSVLNSETGNIITGERVENTMGFERQMQPVSSSNVKAVGQLNNSMLVQFLNSEGTYKYTFEDPMKASEAFTSLTTSGSPGRWIWQNVRGHSAGEPVTPTKIGPSIINKVPTIGGTTASLVQYNLLGRTPVGRVSNFKELSKLVQRKTSNPTNDPNTGSRLEGLLGARKGFRDLGMKIRQDHKVVHYTKTFIGNIYDFAEDYPVEAYTKKDGTKVKAHERGKKQEKIFKIPDRSDAVKQIKVILKEGKDNLKKLEQFDIDDQLIERLEGTITNLNQLNKKKFYPNKQMVIEQFENLIKNYEQIQKQLPNQFQNLFADNYTEIRKSIRDINRAPEKKGLKPKYKKKETTFTNLGLRKKTSEELNTSDFTEYVKTKHIYYTKTLIGNIHDFIEKNLTSDFINLKEFISHKKEDFTVFHGPITRSGPFEYKKNGKIITLYKDWNNIKQRFSEVDYLPYKLAQDQSHRAKEYGFAYNFEPHEDTEQMYADIVVLEDIENLNEVVEDKENYHVSIGFEDHIERGDIQIIDSLDHLAGSGTEIGRCSSGGEEGKRDCIIKRVKNHDQNLTEVVA